MALVKIFQIQELGIYQAVGTIYLELFHHFFMGYFPAPF
jgi:hypothetical protein